MNRTTAAMLGALYLLASFCFAAQSNQVIRLQIDAKGPTGISDGFLGFGYETAAVAQIGYFTSKNARLVRLYKNLGEHGLIRVGGNVSDHTRFIPDGMPAAKTERDITIINQKNLADLADFARATGWQVMWGLNLGTGTPEQAAEEAAAVQQALGDRLHSFEIGNEVDLMRKYARSFDAYHSAFVEYRNAIRKRLPQAAFSGPDVAGNLEFVEKFVAAESPDVKLITHHYYRSGARNPRATMEYLLAADQKFDDRLDRLRMLCAPAHLDFRINEVNSFSGGGKEGVSDTFASSLWCLEYMFNLAAHGCSGVNMETDINQLGFISFYSPIVHDSAGMCTARPEYYAMLAFAMAGHGQMLKVNLAKPTDINLTAYATRDSKGRIWLTLVNKDLAADATMEFSLPHGYSTIGAYLLRAPSLHTKSDVTFAGSAVAADGSWAPAAPEPVPTADGILKLSIQHASAAVVEFKPE